jgi:hypothetical protein
LLGLGCIVVGSAMHSSLLAVIGVLLGAQLAATIYHKVVYKKWIWSDKGGSSGRSNSN